MARSGQSDGTPNLTDDSSDGSDIDEEALDRWGDLKRELLDDTPKRSNAECDRIIAPHLDAVFTIQTLDGGIRQKTVRELIAMDGVLKPVIAERIVQSFGASAPSSKTDEQKTMQQEPSTEGDGAGADAARSKVKKSIKSSDKPDVANQSEKLCPVPGCDHVFATSKARKVCVTDHLQKNHKVPYPDSTRVHGGNERKKNLEKDKVLAQWCKDQGIEDVTPWHAAPSAT
jgi:hypothetical protein